MAQPIDLTISDDEDGPRPCRTSLRVHKGGALPLTNAVVDLTCISSECTEEEQPAKRARPAGSTTVDEATPLRAREERERAASLTTPFCKLPPPDTLDPFMLLHTNADPRGAAHTTTLEALFDGEWSWAVLSNYTMRTRWLQRACASILDARCPLILLAPEGKDVELAAWAAEQPSVCLVHPKVEKFGTHHAKFALLFCAAGLRVVVHTSNYLENEVRNMTQGVWWQDFPRRPASAARPAPTRDALGQFGSTLHAYLRRVLATPIKLTTAGGERAIAGADALLDFDFDAAGAHLLASVPGKHAGAEMERWGHPQLAALVRAEPATSALLGQSRAAMSEVCASDELVLQFSSFSSVSRGGADERCLWLWELCSSLSANPQSARLPPRLLTAHIVWPTRDEVRDCHIGWKGGGAIPALRDNVEKVLRDPVARRCLRRWTSPCHQLGRASVTAHLKSYVRFDPVSKRVAWLAMTSSNLSKAAWCAPLTSCARGHVRSSPTPPHRALASRTHPPPGASRTRGASSCTSNHTKSACSSRHRHSQTRARARASIARPSRARLAASRPARRPHRARCRAPRARSRWCRCTRRRRCPPPARCSPRAPLHCRCRTLSSRLPTISRTCRG